MLGDKVGTNPNGRFNGDDRFSLDKMNLDRGDNNGSSADTYDPFYKVNVSESAIA